MPKGGAYVDSSVAANARDALAVNKSIIPRTAMEM
jgi:hypothetical protein